MRDDPGVGAIEGDMASAFGMLIASYRVLYFMFNIVCIPKCEQTPRGVESGREYYVDTSQQRVGPPLPPPLPPNNMCMAESIIRTTDV